MAVQSSNSKSPPLLQTQTWAQIFGPAKIETRIANADGEFRTIMANKHIFNYRIINEELETSQKTVINLIDALYSKELTGK